MMYTIVFFLSR